MPQIEQPKGKTSQRTVPHPNGRQGQVSLLNQLSLRFDDSHKQSLGESEGAQETETEKQSCVNSPPPSSHLGPCSSHQERQRKQQQSDQDPSSLSNTSCAQDLPQDLWIQILQHVPYEQRLSACALVCQKLSRAAAAATQSLALSFWRSPQRHDAFLSWTSSHGSSLTRLDLSSNHDYASIHQLPCPNLLQLDLAHCSVQLGASSEGVGLLHSCTALTHLSLLYPVLLDGMAGGAPPQMPSAVAKLHCLSLMCAQLPGQPAKDGSQALTDRLFPHLTSLTRFSLSSDSASLQSCFLQHISTMVKLQALSVGSTEPINSPSLPGIERLTALEHLSLSFCSLQPSCLSLPTGLTRLGMLYVTLLPEDTEQQGGELGSLQLLRLLARLPGLRILDLQNIFGQWPQQLSAYSALTASSNLQSLVLNDCDIQTAAWAHVFPAGRQLPRLHKFDARPGDEEEGAVPGPGPFDSTSIARLVTCCPALAYILFTVSGDASMAPLHSLTALTRLDVGPADPVAVRNDLVALSRLRHLSVSVAEPDGDAPIWLQNLVPLTALTNLTALSCSLVDNFEDEEGLPDQRFVSVRNQAPAGSPPDVCLQLLEQCATDQAAQPAVISCVLQQLQQQRQQAAEQAAQLQQLAAARAEAAELRGQLQASESRAQQQEQRLQDVEGQLREVLAALRHQA